MHGDEYESGRLLEEWFLSTSITLPPLAFIPKVSPSAVKLGTRKNKYGHDANRQFYPDTEDPEIVDVMTLVGKYKYSLVIDLHEDPDRTHGMYMYDTNQMDPIELDAFRDTVTKSGANLYTGIDDVDDEHLKRHVDRGYVTLKADDAAVTSGFSSIWFIKYNIASRALTIEVPGKADTSLKKSIIQTVIPYLLTLAKA
jgi:hypothetical protein